MTTAPSHAEPFASGQEVDPAWAAMVGLDADAATDRGTPEPIVVLADEPSAAASGGLPPWAAGLGRGDAPGSPTAPRASAQAGRQGARSAGICPPREAGIMALVQARDAAYERLPLLELVFDRLGPLLTGSIRSLTGGNVDARLAGISAQRFGGYLAAIPSPAMIAVFKASDWGCHGLVTIDGPLRYALVDLLLGGRRGDASMPVAGRGCSTIEAALVERLVRLILDDLGRAFAPVAPVGFQLERMETSARFAAIVRPEEACVLLKLRIQLEDRGGIAELLLPYATLEPVRNLLLQRPVGEKLGRDPIWQSHLASEIWQTNAALEAVLEERTISLSEVVALRVGSVLRLLAGVDSPVTLRCGQVKIATGKVGRSGDRLLVEVEDVAAPRKERP